MIKSGEFLGRLLGPLMKVGLPLIKNELMQLAKSVLITELIAASSADAGISGTTTLIISNQQM